ncbi:MAG: alpha/beta hydrolase [Promethearchaeota archaeon]|nr:MAG: alpha/beta hydrolase [Candidatus Lokiarchaeota archaeon]
MTFSVKNYLNSVGLAEIVFYPRWATQPDPDSFLGNILEIPVSSDAQIGGIFFKNAPDVPTLLFFHGNGEIAQDYMFQIENFLGCGVNVVIVDYRGYGFGTGSPTVLNMIEDSPTIYTFIKNFLIDQEFLPKIFLMGRSLGCIPAAKLASLNHPEVIGVIFESAFADTVKLFQNLFRINLSGMKLTDFNPWSNISFIPKIQSPTLILHGTQDLIIPFPNGKEIYDLLSDSVRKKFIPIEGAQHNDIHASEDQYFGALQSFTQQEFHRTTLFSK